MGFFSGLKSFFGGGNDDASDAAALIAAQNKISQEGIESQFGQTQANLQPFIDAGQTGLSNVLQGSTAGGFSDRLNEIFDTDIFKGLVDERTRAAQGQLSAGGLTRSGTGLETIAGIPQDVGLFIENLLTGRSGALAEGGQSAAGTLGTFGSNKEASLANLRSNTGQAQAAGFLQDKASGSSGFANLLGLGSRVLGGGFAGSSAGGGGGGLGNILSGAVKGLFFSDMNLKTNEVIIGEVGPLNLYKWDWITGVNGTIIERYKEMNTGFMAQEVKEFFPEHVYNYGGFDIIDYVGLRKDLEN